MGHNGHASWQDQVADVQRVTDVDVRQVNVDEFWQLAWQARNFDFVGYVADGRAVQFDCRGNVSVREVQGNFHVDSLLSVNALEVSVQNQLFVCVDLEVAQQNLLGNAVDFQVQDRRVEYFFFQRVVQGVVIERDQHRGFSATVDDTRGLAGNAQAAARSGTLQFAFKCDNFHVKLQEEQGLRLVL